MMTRNMIFAFSVLILSGCCLAPLVGLEPEIKITAKVMDIETGQVIEGANVALTTTYVVQKPNANMGLSREVTHYDWGQSDHNGCCTLRGRSLNGGAIYAKVPLRYYRSGKRQAGKINKDGASLKPNTFYLNRTSNIWEPWNPTFELKLRPIKNPQPMISSQSRLTRVEIPLNTSVKFDFLMQRPLPPYGKGKIADFTITILDREVRDGRKDFSYRYAIEFINDGDGVIPYFTPEEFKQSVFKYPYEAPANGYHRRIEFRCENNRNKSLFLLPDEPQSEAKPVFSAQQKATNGRSSFPIQEFIFKVTRRDAESGKSEEYYGIVENLEMWMEPDCDSGNTMDQGIYEESRFFANPFNRGLEFNRMDLRDYYGLQDAILSEIAKTSNDENFVKAWKEYYWCTYTDNLCSTAYQGEESKERKRIHEKKSAASEILGQYWNNMTIDDIPDKYRKLFDENPKFLYIRSQMGKKKRLDENKEPNVSGNVKLSPISLTPLR